MMQEVSSDDTNGESTFEFVERRLDDLQLTNPITTAQSAVPQNQTFSVESSVASSIAPSLTSVPAASFSQSPAPIPTFAVASLPPPPVALPSFINVSEPNLTAFPPSNPILSPYNPNVSSAGSSWGTAPNTRTFYEPTYAQPIPLVASPVSSVITASAFESDIETESNVSGGGVWGWIKGTVSGNEFLHKVAEKAKNSVDSVITTLDPQMSEYIYSGGDVNMVVASDKAVKVDSIREAFQLILGRATVVIGVSAQSSVAVQPVGFSSGLKGAEDRISALRQSGTIDERQPIIAVENALVEVTPERWFDVGCLVLDDRVLGVTLHSYTQMVPVPLESVQQLQNDTPADYPLRWSGFSSSVGQAVGMAMQVPHQEWHQHVGGVSRKDIIFQAAKVLATSYKRKRDSVGYNQPAWSMG